MSTYIERLDGNGGKYMEKSYFADSVALEGVVGLNLSKNAKKVILYSIDGVRITTTNLNLRGFNFFYNVCTVFCDKEKFWIIILGDEKLNLPSYSYISEKLDEFNDFLVHIDTDRIIFFTKSQTSKEAIKNFCRRISNIQIKKEELFIEAK